MVLDAMRSQAREYATEFDGKPLLSQREINGYLDGVEASKDDIYEAADFLMDFYDDLLDQDTGDVREEFKDDILYDMSIREVLTPRADRQAVKIFGSGLIAPSVVAAFEPSVAGEALAASALACEYFNSKATASNAEAGYNPYSRKIGVSKDRLPERQAYDTLASELFHRYQHEFESPTWTSQRVKDVPPMTEGLERASKISALENFAEQDFRGLDWEELHDMRAASTAVNGYAQALSETSGVSEQDMREIGLSDQKASEAVENVDSDESRGYDLVAASLMAGEKVSGPEVYLEVFENGSDSSAVPHFV